MSNFFRDASGTELELIANPGTDSGLSGSQVVRLPDGSLREVTDEDQRAMGIGRDRGITDDARL